MSEFTVTNGTVEYSRTIRPADFESKVSRATLSFNIAEGSDPAVVLAKVSAIAKEQVHAELGLPHNRGLTPENRPQVVAPPAETGEKRTRGPNKPKEGGAETGRMTGASHIEEVEKTPPSETVENHDPLAELAAANAQPQSPAVAEVASDPIDDLAALAGGQPEPPTVKDVEAILMRVSAHLRKKVGNINDITKLLASFSVPGYRSLTAEQRGPFIDKAKALLDL